MYESDASQAPWETAIAAYTFPRWAELPDIDLYMDQVVTYLTQKLALPFGITDGEEDGHMITAAMINNYVKQKIILPPQKKRYDRERLSALMMLFCVKQVLSIELCGRFLASRAEEGDPQAVYDSFCTVFETVLHQTVATHEDADTAEGREDVYAAVRQAEPVTVAVAIALANKLYAQRLIACHPAPEDTRNKSKDAIQEDMPAPDTGAKAI